MSKVGLFAVLLTMALPLGALAADLAKIVDPWVREAPAASQVLAAYMTMENSGNTALHLVGVTSPLFAKSEMHQTVKKEGMAMMEPVDHIEVPAAGQISLAPGGLHIMLFTPIRPLKGGDKVPLVLQFAGSPPQSVEATVRPGGEHQHHH